MKKFECSMARKKEAYGNTEEIREEAKNIIKALGLKNVHVYVDGIEENDGHYLIMPAEKLFVGCVYPDGNTARRDYDIDIKYTDYNDLKNIVDVWNRARPYNYN